MRKSFLVGIFFVLLFIFSVVLVSFVPAQEVRIKQENDVTVVYNPKKPVSLPGTPTSLLLTEELRIGDPPGKEGYVFAALRAVQIDDEGNIIALDSKDMCIKIFDKNGRHIRTFGRRGQGPGEIQSPVNMHLAGGKEIAILDFRNNRISYFSKTGKSIREIPLKKNRLLNCIPDSRGNLYGEISVLGKKSNMDLIKYNQKLNPIMKVASFKIASVNNPPPFELYERFLFEVRHDDSFIWGSNYRYEFTTLDKDGKTIMRIVKDYNPIKITKENLKREFEARYPDRSLPAKLPKIPDHWPKHYPIFYYFLCDDEGRIFVRTYERDEKNRIYYDVFDSKGRYFARFSHPGDEMIKLVKKNKVYCLIEADEKGVPLIKRYNMEWR